MLSPKARIRITCAREELEAASKALETAEKWLNLKDMTNPPEVNYYRRNCLEGMAVLALLDKGLEDLL